jgi:hypothetical protein
MELNEQQLEHLLKDAEKAHGVYESTLGKRDEDWPKWYAEFIINKLKQ